jgi:Aluminium activated malate transporter
MVLAVAIAPLALLAAMKPSFAVAPFTSVMVLLAPSILHVGPIESAVYRVFEVALGGMIALAVSVFVFPARAHSLAIDAAARTLDQMADALRDLLAACTRGIEPADLHRIQDDIGRALSALWGIGDEARRERIAYLAREPDLRPLLRTLLRLRHDLVMIGRTVGGPLPGEMQTRLETRLARVSTTGVGYLRACNAALWARRGPPPLDAVEAALNGYAEEIVALRREGSTRSLSIDDVERFFTLGFAFEQMHRDLCDLERCVKEWALFPAAPSRQGAIGQGSPPVADSPPVAESRT